MRIAVVTCRQLPEPDPDQALLLSALRDAGLEAALLAWDDPAQDPAGFDLCVLRSTWNYYKAPDAFRAWLTATSAATRLLNPAAVALENLHKGYLRGLEARGVPVVPTAWLDAGAPRSFAALRAELGSLELVIKPAISAGSWRTRRFGAGADAAAADRFIAELVAAGDAMAQPYLASVEAHGERSLIWIDGAITHAIRKSPRFDDGVEQVSAALEPTPAEVAFAEAALGDLADRLLYGRVDVMWDDAGAMRVSELELIEPSLFLRQHPPALARLVAAIQRAAT